MADQIVLEVPDSLDGARVDKAIAELLHLSRAGASVLMKSGVTVDGVAVRPADRVTRGQMITCAQPERTMAMVAEEVAFDVLYEDDDVIVVDKPPGVVVHPGRGQTRGTLAAGLINRFPELVGVGAADRWGLVHRLDKDTSGAILVAHREGSFQTLTEDLRRRRITREYTTLVEGRMGAETGTIDAPIGRDPAQPTRQAVVPTGKPARTHYELIRDFAGSDASLLEVRLETGRTHQIRVHMAAIGHPVVGDRTYGATREDLRPPRIFLHASRLTFSHPATDAEMTVESPLPDDLSGVLGRLS